MLPSKARLGQIPRSSATRKYIIIGELKVLISNYICMYKKQKAIIYVVNFPKNIRTFISQVNLLE